MSTSSAIPLSDAGRLRRPARRTRIVQLIALVAVLGAAAWLLVAAFRIDRSTTAFAPESTTAIVVLDVSASISSETYDRILATLDRLADSNGRYGLVLFSDTAYMALPPGTDARRTAAVRALLPRPAQDRGRAARSAAKPMEGHVQRRDADLHGPRACARRDPRPAARASLRSSSSATSTTARATSIGSGRWRWPTVTQASRSMWWG